MDNIYLLIITNRASNIIEDLETLRLLSKVVPDIAGATNNLSEDKISDKCFELIFAFDEVITIGGYREPINLAQIRTNLEMDSHEEKLHKMIKQSKIDQAKDQAKEAAKSIKEKQKYVFVFMCVFVLITSAYFYDNHASSNNIYWQGYATARNGLGNGWYRRRIGQFHL